MTSLGGGGGREKMHIKITELNTCPNCRQNSECHRDVMHIKIAELNTCPNCRQNLGPTRWLLGPGLRKFFFSSRVTTISSSVCIQKLFIISHGECKYYDSFIFS